MAEHISVVVYSEKKRKQIPLTFVKAINQYKGSIPFDGKLQLAPVESLLQLHQSKTCNGWFITILYKPGNSTLSYSGLINDGTFEIYVHSRFATIDLSKFQFIIINESVIKHRLDQNKHNDSSLVINFSKERGFELNEFFLPHKASASLEDYSDLSKSRLATNVYKEILLLGLFIVFLLIVLAFMGVENELLFYILIAFFVLFIVYRVNSKHG